ncbi:MAG: hypothetical protein ACYCWW_16170 [Deltaproteobacteria bacterium]
MQTAGFALEKPVFWRRRCPACARAFRLRPSRTAQAALALEILRRAPHANADEIGARATAGGSCLCPYCGRRGPLEHFLGQGQEALFDRAAEWLGAELRFEQLRFAEQHLAENPFVTFVPVAPDSPSLRAPEEPRDLAPVPLLCCGEQLEIERDFQGDLSCPYCTPTK